MRNFRRMATGVALFTMAAGLVGTGVRAAITDSATASETQSVGTFGCQLSSPDSPSNWVWSNNNHTGTLQWPEIDSSASSNLLDSLTVTNTGSMPAVVHWTETPGGTITWQPTGRMGYAAGNVGNPMSTDVTLAPGASSTYVVGFMWATLTNADLGHSASIAYTANCSEVPPVQQSKISFVGALDATGATVALPAGTAAGDFAITYEDGGNIPGIPNAFPSGAWTPTAASNNGYSTYTRVTWHMLTGADLASSVVIPSAAHVMVAVYRGVAGLGKATGSNPGNNQNWACNTSPVAPYLSVTNGTSWVVCVGGDGTGTFNVAGAYAPAVWGTTLRSGAFTDNKTGLSDTNGGVTAWSKPVYASGDYAHGGANYGLELLSQ